MWNIDDFVVYGKDVCVVRDILKKKFNNEDYYLLIPMKDNSLKIEVPVSNKNGKIRNLISLEQVNNIINNIPNVEPINTDNKFIEHEYKELLSTGDHLDLIKVIKTTYLRNKERVDNNKKATEKDTVYFEMAEEYLYNEFAVVLGYSFDEVKEYITKKVSNLLNS